MITRFVKMSFMPQHVDQFKEIFYKSQKMILDFEGCMKVDLMKDVNNEGVFFTISFWRSEDDLTMYRQSYLFKSTWSKVKPLFSEKAEAWSLISDNQDSI